MKRFFMIPIILVLMLSSISYAELLRNTWERSIFTIDAQTRVFWDDSMGDYFTGVANDYAYIRLSKTGRYGVLNRDLIPGEKLKVTINVGNYGSNGILPYFKSTGLNIPKIIMQDGYNYQKYTFYTTVSENVTNKAFIGFYPSSSIRSGISFSQAGLSIEETNQLVRARWAFYARNRASRSIDSVNGVISMMAPSDYEYLYVRASKTGSKGALFRDLLPGEKLKIKLKAKSSSLLSYIKSSQLNIPKTRFTKVDEYEDFIFDVTVKEDVNNRAFIGIYTVDAGENVSVQGLEILEEDTVAPSISIESHGFDFRNGAYVHPINNNYSNIYMSATDEYDGDLTQNVVTEYTYNGQTTATLQNNLVGTHHVTYTVTDSSGNTASETRKIRVLANMTYCFYEDSQTQIDYCE